MKRNIFITGFSGTGKTTTARSLARSLGWRFVDTDDEIVDQAGKPIEDIFNQDGEQGFRDFLRFVAGHSNDVVREPLGGFGSDAGQFSECVYEARDYGSGGRGGIEGHGPGMQEEARS